MRLFRIALVAGVVLSAGSMTAQPLRVHHAATGGVATGHLTASGQDLRADLFSRNLSGHSKVRFTAATTGVQPDGTRPDRGARFRGLLDQIKQPNGGFTVHAMTGRQPTSGYALSIYKDRETTKPVEDLELIDLVRFAKANEDLLRHPDNYFGVWHDPKSNLVYLDISIVVRSAAEAERLGRQNQQGSYFDLEEGQLVDIEEEAA
jgi:hypothetical protein